MTKELRRTALFTDIHWGKKNNSDQHTQDCWDFVMWFIQQVRRDPTIDSIAFLGDWFENRNTLNIATGQRAYEAAKKLSGIGLPVFFVVGNHDMFHKHTRDITSVKSYEALPNFTLIDQPILIPNMGGGTMFAPYMFEHEYAPLYEKYHKTSVWMGHFEFRGFVVTGYGILMPTGPIHSHFDEVEAILCGHFHKRQAKDNVLYIGNAFPLDFSDSEDPERGMTVFNHSDKTVDFTAWPDQPHFTKIKMSALLEMTDYTPLMLNKNRIQCIVDIPVTYEESTEVRQTFLNLDIAKAAQIREFKLEESTSLRQTLTDTQSSLTDEDVESVSIEELILKLLPEIKSNEIDAATLVDIFKAITRDNNQTEA